MIHHHRKEGLSLPDRNSSVGDSRRRTLPRKMWRWVEEWHRREHSTNLLRLQWDLESQLEFERGCWRKVGPLGCCSSCEEKSRGGDFHAVVNYKGCGTSVAVARTLILLTSFPSSHLNARGAR